MPEFYLSPWAFSTEDNGWVTPWPGNTRAVLDLRSDTQIDAGEGFGLFEVKTPVTTSALKLGEGFQETLNRGKRNNLEAELGLGERIVATQLNDIIWELLAHQSDPLGVSRWKPFMPTSKGRLNLWLNGQLWKTTAFDWQTSPEAPAILKTMQENYRQIREEVIAGRAAPDMHRKYLGALMAGAKRPRDGDWERFIPSDLPSESPIPPSTTVSDNFNRANEDWPTADWKEHEITGGSDGAWGVRSNEAVELSTSVSPSAAEYLTDLSTDDMYSQIDLATFDAPASNNNWGGAAARCSENSTAFNGYVYAGKITSTSTVTGELIKYTGSGPTFGGLTSESETISATDTVRIEADGSDLVGKINGSQTTSTTDTSHSGQLRAGLFSKIRAFGEITLDDFEAADLSAGAAATVIPPFIHGIETIGVGGLLWKAGLMSSKDKHYRREFLKRLGLLLKR